MKKFLLFAVISLVSYSYSIAQGTVRGKVTDKNGETVIGAPVVLSTIHSYGTTTDLDGNYTLKITDSTEQVLVVSYIGFETQKKTVHPVNGEVIILNFVLTSSTQAIKEVEITAKAVKSKEYYMEKIKEKSATTIDYISSETMKKTGDVNVVAAVARVSGVSTNGSFITVRGIGDRYVKTAINGSRIPTLDPFTNNIKLDLFPASLVDNIIITKTASPELPGDWAGAYLSIETKDYPDQLTLTEETSFGYNDHTSFKNVLSSDHSSTEWLGYDNGFRDHDHSSFNEASPYPTDYQEFVAVGLGPYFNSLGITQENWTYDGANGENYYRLGLVELGLLAPALINDDDAVKIARDQYMNGTYESEAYKVINADVPATGRSFPANWDPVRRKAPLNFSQSFSIGNQVNLFRRPFGFIGGFRYGSSVNYDPVSKANRRRFDGSLSSSEDREVGRETNGWSALANAAYKFSPNHSVSILFMPGFTGVSNVAYGKDTIDPSNNYILTKPQLYEERKQLVYQFKSEHYVPVLKLKAELNASYTNGKSSTPDFKYLQYYQSPITGLYNVSPTTLSGIHRYYRYLSDNIFDSRLVFELPVSKKTELVRKLKFGGTYQRNDKKSDQYDYRLSFIGNSTLENDNLDEFFSLDNFGIHEYTDVNGNTQSTIDQYYEDYTTPADHNFGNSEVKGAFAMVDYGIMPRIRFSGGIRVEKASIFTDVYQFDSLGLARNDPRRAYSDALPLANPGKLDETSWLPSASLIYKLRNVEDAPINLRFNYSEAVARPSIRELSDVAAFDYEYRAFVFGNSDLKMVKVRNYDFRAEAYFKSGDNVSVSVFYKDFKNHIELVNSGGYTWQNVDKSWVRGVELEGKKVLAKNFDIGANVTIVESHSKYVRTTILIGGGSVKIYLPQDTVTRTMFGQAPYVVNAILSYKAEKLGLVCTASYNVQGERLVIASDNAAIPDIYEQPRHLADFKVTKTLGKHFSVSGTVRDILNTSVERKYHGTGTIYDTYNYGTNYVLGISYKL
ncbi:MAG TPA: TonB-dependent receptor [Bacteroidia bacterium]|nr:TonB-dependent receptor [Bacteroidia bacterium]